ncbi:MAG: flagellar hook-length control protein FliK [Gammaproteobacteria bacterium]
MRINAPEQASPAITPGSPKALDAWRVGQVLNATVIETAAQGAITLRINNTLIQAQSQLPVSPGQQLSLQVANAGKQTVLKVIEPTASTDPVTQALRVALPRQTALPPLLANLAWLSAPSEKAQASPLSPAVTQLASQLFNNLASAASTATAQGFKDALYNSGLFLENKLAHAAPGQEQQGLKNDFKGGLLRLLEGLHAEGARSQNSLGQPSATQPPPLPGSPLQAQPAVSASLPAQSSSGAIAELTHQTEGTLARLQLNQLASLPTAEHPAPLWTLELPLRHNGRADLLHMRIEQDQTAKKPGAQNASWTVSLGLDLDGLGPMHARITLAGERISTTLWAERGETVALLDKHINELHNGLTRAGLKTDTIRCQLGAPPRATTESALTNEMALVDLTA